MEKTLDRSKASEWTVLSSGRVSSRRLSSGRVLAIFAVALLMTFAGLFSAAAMQLETAPALSGLDPVALVEGKTVAGKPIEGKATWNTDHQGYRYHFASKKNLSKFEKNPERYRIQNQYCPVVPSAPARPDLFAVHAKKIYIFATPECVEEFRVDPGKYVGSD